MTGVDGAITQPVTGNHDLLPLENTGVQPLPSTTVASAPNLSSPASHAEASQVPSAIAHGARPPPSSTALSGHRPVNRLNLCGLSLHSDTILSIHRFLSTYIVHPYIEFEGKVGLICNKNSRLNLGVMGTTPLRSGYFETLPDVSLNFVPGVSEEQFQRLLRILTQWSNAEHVRYGIKYRHSVELDHFHEDRVRTSINEKTQQPLRHVKKSSLGHLDIHVPSSQYDIRFSANTGNLRQFTLVVVIF
uniref:mRNA 5'-phosphatase n=1 Tax=Spongospora subterranea TaxID=70186 RepID=A0A0H5QRH5_9EUKA|eukprot:CRZ04640.1 hypothetical protein [Spongospora subterranea]